MRALAGGLVAASLAACQVSPCPGTNVAEVELDHSGGTPKIAKLATCWGKDSDTTDITIGRDDAGNLTLSFSSTMARGAEAQANALAASAESQAKITELLGKVLERAP